MNNPKIIAPGANATTFITIIDVEINIVKMSIESLSECPPSEYYNNAKWDRNRLIAALNVFTEELHRQIAG